MDFLYFLLLWALVSAILSPIICRSLFSDSKPDERRFPQRSCW